MYLEFVCVGGSLVCEAGVPDGRSLENKMLEIVDGKQVLVMTMSGQNRKGEAEV